MGVAENNIMNAAMVALSKVGALVFRNNVGTGWAGKMKRGKDKPVFVGREDVVVRNARPLNAGLCVGSSDIIGGMRVVITQEMVGQTVLIFLAPEMKTATGRASKEQLAFIAAVVRAGGQAGVARSAAEAVAIARG